MARKIDCQKSLILFFVIFLSLFKAAYSKSRELDLTYKQNHHSAKLKNPPTLEEYVDSGYQFLTKKVYLLSNTVDSIFTQRSIDQSKNKSYLRFWYEFSKGEGEEVNARPDFRLRIYLKETRKLLRFTFDNTSRSQETQSDLNQTQAAVNAQNGDKKLAASIGLNLKEAKNYRISTKVGIRLRVPPNIFLRSNYSYENKFGEIDFSAQNSFFYYSLDGFGNTTNVNFLYQINDASRFLFETFGTWLEPRAYNAGSGVQYIYNYSDYLSMNSQIGLNADKEDRTLAVRNYFWSWGARRLLYKDWFFAELSPILSWARKNEWAPSWSFFFRLEAFFGDER